VILKGTLGGFLQIRDHEGENRIVLTGASGTIKTEVLEVTGGADLVESFEADADNYDPGTVVVISETDPGCLTESSSPYDRKVAGVISGSGGLSAGIELGKNHAMENSIQITLTGRVYVKCSTENGVIRPGDLLTTSSIQGHAMKASDPVLSFGAVIGKAMSSLEEGTGLVLVLCNLQ